MFKILKNLKKSWVAVLAIIILLCIQAATDLALPDYTSKIVNNGIQSGGIEIAVPNVISKADMDNLLFFADDETSEQILSNYELIEDDMTSYQEKVIDEFFGKDYSPDANTVYVVKDLADEQLNDLENLISTPLLEYSAVSNEETATQIREQIKERNSSIAEQDDPEEVNGIVEYVREQQKLMLESDNVSIIEILKQVSEEYREEILSEFTAYIGQMSESVKEQAAISSVKQLYSNLGIDTAKIQNDYILISGLQMLGIALISMISAVLIMLLSSRVAAKLGETLRDKVFKKVLSYSTAELNEFSTASLITRSTNDIQQIQQLITLLFRVVVYAPIIGIGGFVKVLTSSDSSMAWIIGVAVVAILIVVATLFAVSMPKFKKLQDLIDKLNLVSREILTGLPVIRAFNKEKKEEDRFAESNNNLMKANIFVNRTMSMMMPLLMFIMSSISVLIVWEVEAKRS